jgi:hypothetical protein
MLESVSPSEPTTGHRKVSRAAGSPLDESAAEEVKESRLPQVSPGLSARLLWPLRFPFRSARIWSSNRRFQNWRLKNPTKQFRDFYAEIEEPNLLRGKKHPSLGSNLRRMPFRQSGLSALQMLREHGLTPDDVCVDYGCGTLRVGIHVINYLKPGAYWGLDSEPILREGLKLVDADLIAERAPHLRVISPKSVAEVAAKKPSLLYSLKVLTHVHPDELSEYFRNILTIIGDSGQAIITGKWSEGETLQFSGQSWAHSVRSLQEPVLELGGEITVLRERDYWLADFGRVVKRGTLRVTKSRSVVVREHRGLRSGARLPVGSAVRGRCR